MYAHGGTTHQNPKRSDTMSTIHHEWKRSEHETVEMVIHYTPGVCRPSFTDPHYGAPDFSHCHVACVTWDDGYGNTEIYSPDKALDNILSREFQDGYIDTIQQLIADENFSSDEYEAALNF